MSDKLPGVIVAVAVVAAVFVLMALGWRGRKRSQLDVEALPAIPEQLHVIATYLGQYVSTTSAGDWLDRIAARGLGIRGQCELTLAQEGLLYDRHGAPAVFIPAESIREVNAESGMVGKFVEKQGLFVLTWHHGQRELDTGFRPRFSDQLDELMRNAESIGRTQARTREQREQERSPRAAHEAERRDA